jgi:exonuclease III
MGGDVHTVVHGGRKLRLDHILVSRALALRCREVTIDNAALLDETESEDLSARRLGSYHAPIVAEFELP